jgi:predicted N-formylglutamate amidohydrolase
MMRDSDGSGASPRIDGRIDGHSEETFTVLPGRADGGFVLFCDHAGNAFPPSYGTLGLPAAELERHIAYDIGAAGVVRRLSAITGVPAILSRYSRLLIDLNRGVDDPTLVMRLSDGAVVPGNRHLDAAERETRVRAYYDPYHNAAAALIDRCIDAGTPPAILSVHSFTPVWKGTPRPWHASVLWDRDPRLAMALLQGLRSDAQLVIGDNEPYSGRLRGDTLWRHGTMRGLAHAIIEIRQDLVASEAGQAAWAHRLVQILRDMSSRRDLVPLLRQIAFHGSHTD